MSNTKTVRTKRVIKAMASLSRARAITLSRKEFGVDGIRQYVKDVDSDWLKEWEL
jgi:hypothetical protein